MENARIQPRHHPRCGTSFLFVVIVVSILFSSVAFTYVEWQNLWVRIGMHLLLLVPVVGMASAALLLGETLSGLQLTGAVLIMAGLYINVFGLRLVRPGMARG